MYKLSTHSLLAKQCKDVNLFQENELVGAGENVSGLEVSKYRLPDERGTIKAPCLGGEVNGTKKSWHVTPAIKPKTAPSFKLEVSKLKVTIPYRDDYERKLLSSLNSQMPTEEVYREETGMFGGKKMKKQTTDNDTSKVSGVGWGGLI